MNEPRICIIGAGNLSTRRIYPYIGAAGAVLAGVCDLNREKAEENARLWGGKAYTDYNDMLDTEKPDGVIVCICAEMHARTARKILPRGIPVYTEKPPAPTAAAALEIARLAKANDVLCMTAFKKRHNIANSRAREWISGFPSEDLYAISIDYASAQYSNDSQRRSFLFDFCVHAIDLIGYLGGDVDNVFAFAKGQDAYAVSLQFACGAVGTLTLNDGRSFGLPTEEIEISIKGGNWMTIHNSSSWKIAQDGRACEWREPNTFVSGGDSGYDTGHLAELQCFVAALRNGDSTTKSSIYESYKSMLLYEAIVASVDSGDKVTINYEAL